MTTNQDADLAPRLRRTVLAVALLNLAYFFVEFGVAWASNSVSLLADSVDFLEDTAVNLMIFVALGRPLVHRATAGRVMTLVLLLPGGVAIWEGIQRLGAPETPDVPPLIAVSVGAMAVNGLCAFLLARVRYHGGSLSRAAFLSARNDVAVNVAVIAMGLITAVTGSGWPDLILGAIIILLALHAAKEVWEVSGEERLAAKALAGEDVD